MNQVKRATAIRSFSMNNMLLEADLDKIEREFDVDLGRHIVSDVETADANYSQFDEKLRREAQAMAVHYELFYCLEKSIRTLICDVFEAAGEEDWWDNLVPDSVKANTARSMKREAQAAVTPRSTLQIDYTTFGELGEIIKSNWGLFGSVFNDVKAVEKVMGNLNSLRNPIAHCSPLAPDEVLRLKLSLSDWFRILE